MIRPVRLLAVLLAATLSIAADTPRALAAVAGGEWSISRFADGHSPTKACLADPALLAQWEHRYGRCKSVLISDKGAKVITEYRCEDGGFGRSQIEVLTPRTLRVSTQGISSNFPFNYVLHARRLGECRARR